MAAGAGASTPAKAADPNAWPPNLFVVYQAPDFQDPVSDVAETSDGRFVLASKSGILRRISRTGRVQAFADLKTGVAGIAAAQAGSVLAVENARLVRVLPDGRRATVAGTGHAGYSGDGGPALSARIHPADVNPGAFGDGDSSGITRTQDGSIVFTDLENNRLRRIRPDGTIETIAGTGARSSCGNSPIGDGGPASAAVLSSPADVSQLRDGSLTVSDRWNCRIRRIAPDGTIATIAGSGEFDAPLPASAGQLATSLPMYLPRGLAELPNGDTVVCDGYQIDRIARDGAWHPLLPRSTTDFAGRAIDAAESGATGITVTREGGVLIAWGSVYYLAPAHSAYTLVRIRDSRVSDRKVTVYVTATRPARATLQVRLGGRLIAQSAQSISSGRRRLDVTGRFAARPHEVRVTLRSTSGATVHDKVMLHLGTTLSMSYVTQLAQSYADEVPLKQCRRVSARRIDCDYRGGFGSPYTIHFTLKHSGVVTTS